MHSKNIAVEDLFWTVHFNGDFSGDIILTAPAGMLLHELRTGTEVPYEVVKVPFYVLVEIVAEAVRAQRVREQEERNEALIDQIENESANEILGLGE